MEVAVSFTYGITCPKCVYVLRTPEELKEMAKSSRGGPYPSWDMQCGNCGFQFRAMLVDTSNIKW
jgi:bacterioferritin-associated ferredoxin